MSFREPGEDEALEEGPCPQSEVAEPSPSPAPAVGNKKKKNKSLASRGPTALPKNRGSGFEEYFADPPMTPQEAMEEKNDIYSDDFSFEARMQSCIQRYRSRRRLQGELTHYFDEYLFLGGVDTTPGAYTGLDPKELKDLTPAERREATTRDVIYGNSAAGDRFYDGDDENWSVDFAGVAAGYLSTALVGLTGLENGPMLAAIGVVENFLRYVLHHDVCPEYSHDVKRALQVCDQAREEWPMLRRLQTDLPGCFNLAAAELFCQAQSEEWDFQMFRRPEGFEAKPVFHAALAMIDDPEPFDSLCKGTLELAAEYQCTLEVTDIQYPNDDVVKNFKSLTLELSEGAKLRLKSIGKVMLKPAVIEDEWDHPDVPLPFQEDEIKLYFEENILKNLKVGMKLRATLGDIGSGVRFVKAIHALVPSFYTFLPQTMMKHYKQPREDDRPAPSIRNLEINDGRMEEE